MRADMGPADARTLIRALKDGDVVFFLIGALYGAVASYDDVTARVEQDRRMRHEAETDPLTGLANRRASDVEPDRMEATKDALRSFVSAQPSGVEVGLVAFSDSAVVLQPATGGTEG